jgi:hypothetical protein
VVLEVDVVLGGTIGFELFFVISFQYPLSGAAGPETESISCVVTSFSEFSASSAEPVQIYSIVDKANILPDAV